jgi:hypothetical protein
VSNPQQDSEGRPQIPYLTNEASQQIGTPTPQRVKAERPVFLKVGVALAIALVAITQVPQLTATPSNPTPAPTAINHTAN